MSIDKRASIFNSSCDKCRKLRPIQKRKNRICKYCWEKKWSCKSKFCKKFQLLPGLIKYFWFDKNKLGHFSAVTEYYRIEFMLRRDYLKNKLSIPDLIKKYWYYDHPRNFSKILDSIGIKKRTPQDWSTLKRLAGLTRLWTRKFPFKQQWHTTREWTQVYLRSSYETEVANKLDLLKTPYITEKPIIQYINEKWNPSAAYPDFYLPDHNILIEVKSTYFRNKENMELKFKAYEALWYKCVLIVDKKVVIWENYAIEVWMYQEEVMA